MRYKTIPNTVDMTYMIIDNSLQQIYAGFISRIKEGSYKAIKTENKYIFGCTYKFDCSKVPDSTHDLFENLINNNLIKLSSEHFIGSMEIDYLKYIRNQKMYTVETTLKLYWAFYHGQEYVF